MKSSISSLSSPILLDLGGLNDLQLLEIPSEEGKFIQMNNNDSNESFVMIRF